MYRKSFQIDEHTDTALLLESLRDALTTADLVFEDSAFRQLEQAVYDLSSQVTRSVELGVSFKSIRTVNGDDFEVTLVASCGLKTTLIDRIREFFFSG